MTAGLTSVSAANVDVSLDVSADKPSTGNGPYVTMAVRRQGTSDYHLKVVFGSSSTSLILSRAISGVETILVQRTIATLQLQNGVHMRFQVSGTSPSTLRASVWAVGTPPPSTWQLTGTDSTAALQSAGSFLLTNYLSSSATNAPITLSFDNLLISPP